MESGATSLALVPSASCSICRDTFSEVATTVALTCGHIFHQRCAEEWLKQSQTCPQCRRQLRARGLGRELMRVYLSFGEATPDDGEAPGLAELRSRLAAATEKCEETDRLLKRQKRQDAQLRRDLSQRQRQFMGVKAQLSACQESLTQQEAENSQLMLVMEQQHEELSAMAKRLREQLEEERLTKKQLNERLRQTEADLADRNEETARLVGQLQASQHETLEAMETLQAEKASSVRLLDQLLTLEAENSNLLNRLEDFYEGVGGGHPRRRSAMARIIADAPPQSASFASLPDLQLNAGEDVCAVSAAPAD